MSCGAVIFLTRTCPKQPWPETLVEGRVPNAVRNARPGAVGPDARKASPQRRGVLDVRRRRRRAKPDKADGPTPPALPRIGGGAFKLAQEGAAREAGQRAEDTAKNVRPASFVLVWNALSRGKRRFGRHDVAARLRRGSWEPHF